jgi:hypothetical protein
MKLAFGPQTLLSLRLLQPNAAPLCHRMHPPDRYGAKRSLTLSIFPGEGHTACSRHIGIGLTGSRCGLLLRRALRLGLGQLNLRLLSYAIRGERIVVNGNERVVIEIRLMVHRHRRAIRH